MSDEIAQNYDRLVKVISMLNDFLQSNGVLDTPPQSEITQFALQLIEEIKKS